MIIRVSKRFWELSNDFIHIQGMSIDVKAEVYTYVRMKPLHCMMMRIPWCVLRLTKQSSSAINFRFQFRGISTCCSRKFPCLTKLCTHAMIRWIVLLFYTPYVQPSAPNTRFNFELVKLITWQVYILRDYRSVSHRPDMYLRIFERFLIRMIPKRLDIKSCFVYSYKFLTNSKLEGVTRVLRGT